MKADPGLVGSPSEQLSWSAPGLSLQPHLSVHFPRYPIGHHSESLVVLKFTRFVYLFAFQYLLKFIMEKMSK